MPTGFSCIHLFGGYRTCFHNCDPPVLFRRVRFVQNAISRPDLRRLLDFLAGTGVPMKPSKTVCVISAGSSMEETFMRKALAILATVATVGSTAVTAPAEARGLGPGLAFGLAAGALTAGAMAGAYGPYGYGYGPGYGYYGYPAYYDDGPGAYAYYGGGPYYYRHRYW